MTFTFLGKDFQRYTAEIVEETAIFTMISLVKLNRFKNKDVTKRCAIISFYKSKMIRKPVYQGKGILEI